MFRAVAFAIAIAVVLVLAFIIASGGENGARATERSTPDSELSTQGRPPVRIILNFGTPDVCQPGQPASDKVKRVNLSFTDKGIEVRQQVPAQCSMPGSGVLKLETRALPQPLPLVSIIETLPDGC